MFHFYSASTLMQGCIFQRSSATAVTTYVTTAWGLRQVCSALCGYPFFYFFSTLPRICWVLRFKERVSKVFYFNFVNLAKFFLYEISNLCYIILHRGIFAQIQLFWVAIFSLWNSTSFLTSCLYFYDSKKMFYYLICSRVTCMIVKAVLCNFFYVSFIVEWCDNGQVSQLYVIPKIQSQKSSWHLRCVKSVPRNSSWHLPYLH